MARALGAAVALAAALVHAASASPPAVILDYADLPGWEDDDHAAALAVFDDVCPDLRRPDWAAVCAFATTGPEPRRFFETFFRPVRLGGPDGGLFTGYYEPEVRASPRRTGYFRVPVYRMPPELEPGTPWLTRAEIETGDSLHERDLEIAWLSDPVDLHHLQLQGSGRLNMTDGRVLRLGFAGQNGHPRRPAVAELIRRGVFEPHEASTDALRAWVRRNPLEGRELLRDDSSYVFFRVLEDYPPQLGPPGAMNRPLVEGRSLAIDPAHVPLGAPVWVEARGAEPIRTLMIALDTGGAIKGAQRGDIFFGTGAAAGRAAARVRDRGQLVVLLPVELAYRLVPEG